jgi:hypothetical protein
VSVTEDLLAAFAPWMTPDLEDYLTVIGEMFSEVELYAMAEDDELGYAVLLDPDTAPVQALPYLALYVGERLPVGLEEVMQREWIKDAPNQRRGTLESVVRVAQRTLTGQRTVSILERAGAGDTDDPDQLLVITYTPETPDADAVERDLRRDAVPADIVLTYQMMDAQTYTAAGTGHASYAAAATEYATYDEARAELSGYTTYTRPRPT